MDRVAKIVDGLNLKNGLGLEIGALHLPILRRPFTNVLYVDHADTATLREKYAGHRLVRVDDIVEVDLVWTDRPLLEIAGDRRFHHIVASHVIEHAPDIVWWIDEMASVLRPLGSLRLVIPDKRFTFDILRNETTIADSLAAWLARQRRPSPRDILDFWGHYRSIDCAAAWRGELPPDTSLHMHELPAALNRCRETLEQGVYHDVHCTVFTPASFVTLMKGLAGLGLLQFACTNIIATSSGEMEFFVHMMKSDDEAVVKGSWDWAGWWLTQKGGKKKSLLS